MQEEGYRVDQVVHDYGDVCQAVTELARERRVPITVDEFQILNRMLDNAIAELNGQIEMNRYNTHLRRQLLGVYAEKQQTLREVMKGVTS